MSCAGSALSLNAINLNIIFPQFLILNSFKNYLNIFSVVFKELNLLKSISLMDATKIFIWWIDTYDLN